MQKQITRWKAFYTHAYKCITSAEVMLVTVIVLYSTISYSQDQKYAPSPVPLISKDHGLQAEINELDNAKKRYANEIHDSEQHNPIKKGGTYKTTSGLPDTTCVVTIPVVFHIFHPKGSLGVITSQINYALNDLNVTFAGADADYVSVNPLFATVKSYTKIRFAKAAIDPKGNPTTGVIYYQDKQSGLGNGTGWDNEIATMAWDNYKYFNIYVMNDLYADGVTNNSGVCWYPFTSMSDVLTARMVYNYWYFGYGGSSFNDHEFNETFTHETGHYLNLYHTFDGTSCTGPGDYCGDTPPTDISCAGCSVSRCGGPINGENYMDYNTTCYKNFTMDQNARMETALMHPARQSLWQYDNLVATGVVSPTTTNPCVNANKFFSFSKKQLSESQANDGSIETPPVKIYACGGTLFSKVGATLAPGIDYTLSGLPAGLTALVVTASDGKSATLTLGGFAASHAKINSVTNVIFTFTNAAVTGGGVSSITNYADTFKIDFYDPWHNTCDNPTGVTATALVAWTRFETIGPMPRYFGLWFDTGNFYLENYGRGIITTGVSSDNIAFLATGTTIGPSSIWRAGGSQGVLYSPAYTTLDGLTGYVGFRMQAQNDFYYGWMKIQVSSAGVTLLEYQYNNKPNASIAAGSTCLPLGVSNTQPANVAMVYPNPSSGRIYIENANPDFMGKKFEVFYIDGRKVKSGEIISTRQEINCENLASGVYLLRIINKNGQSESVCRITILQ